MLILLVNLARPSQSTNANLMRSKLNCFKRHLYPGGSQRFEHLLTQLQALFHVLSFILHQRLQFQGYVVVVELGHHHAGKWLSHVVGIFLHQREQEIILVRSRFSVTATVTAISNRK